VQSANSLATLMSQGIRSSSYHQQCRQKIQRPIIEEWLYWSAKDKFHCFKWEIVISCYPHEIIWVSGPHVGSASDITIYRQNGLMEILRQSRDSFVLMADLGYQGEPDTLWTPLRASRGTTLSRDEIALNDYHHAHRQVIERCNKRLKQFNVWKHTWRSDSLFAEKVGIIICKLTNLCFTVEPL
jgi:hypothetical protein